MAQISSAYPTAGGLYHWGSILGNRFTGWVTAWFNLLGLVTVLGAINVGTYYFFMGSFGTPYFGLEDTHDGSHRLPRHHHRPAGAREPYGHRPDREAHRFLRLPDLRDGDRAVGRTAWSRRDTYEIGRLFTFANYSGEAGGNVWPATSGTWVFLLGLLLPIYTITGYDASAHTSEETVKAADSVPRGMVSSVLWSALFGYIMLCSFVLMLPEHGRRREAGLERVLLGDGRSGQPGRSRTSSTSPSSSASGCAAWRPSPRSRA